MPYTHSHRLVSEVLARGGRTTVQAALAIVVAAWLNPHLPNLVDNQRAVLIGILTAVFASGLAWLEDRFGFALLREVQVKVPTVDNKPAKPIRKRKTPKRRPRDPEPNWREGQENRRG